MKDRSQPEYKKIVIPAPSRFELSNQFGTVRVYTRRHINGCQLPTADHNHCSCPKWIYAKARGAHWTQKAANTPSFAEACDMAQKILRGFDPEISQARAITAPAPGISLEDALTRYYAVLGSRKLAADYLGGSITPVFDRRKARPHDRGRRAVNLPLLDYLDTLNRSLADPVKRVDQITGGLLDDWAATWETNDLTSKLWRTVATSFFRWTVQRGYAQKLPTFGEKMRVKAGNRCGYFTDDQMQKIRAALVFYRSRTRPLPDNYAERLAAMIALGRWAGMAIADIVCFSPQVNLSPNNVLTYRRHKSQQMAVVLLDPAIAARLRSIPPEAGSMPEQPLRFADRTEDRSRGIWRDRFQKLCDLAGIGEIETEIGTRRRAHPHMLRDTFAIDAITRGVSLENVAKMLGHATVEMTQRAYLFWVAKRLDYCIEDQRAALARVQIAAAVETTNRGDGSALRRTLVH
jgi:site-specific recombinase XerD